ITLPANLYSLNLQVEAEARQVAQFALKQGQLNAITVFADTPILQRIHHAFVDEFLRGGGRHVAQVPFSAEPEALGRLKDTALLKTADMAFLALDLQRARLARPYLGPLALYATSQVNPGDAGPLVNFDLAGVRFLDMPWLLQRDHPAVMIYPRRDFHGVLDLERLYALGIDSFRVGQALLTGTTGPALDGVTGHIILGGDRLFVRELAAAQFTGGKLVTPSPAGR
ncbi:MAG: penicillin-binding protein activator, partial [Betaproteobacteria bacterium]|nr:penicillin-binding protein activator [Betaproteobacteria bacterium]